MKIATLLIPVLLMASLGQAKTTHIPHLRKQGDKVSTGPVVIVSSGTGKLRLRLEAVSDDVVRVWYSTSDHFARRPSHALETMPKTRVPLRVADKPGQVWLRTERLLIEVDKKTLAVSAFDAKSKAPILEDLGLAQTQPDGSWHLTEGLQTDEHLLGLGQDNRNHGKLDRRGTIRELWAGQQINSGNVTAQYPVPFMLSTGHGGHSYGVFFDNVHRLKYDLGKTNPNLIDVEATGGDADLYIINGPTPKNVISRYTAMTGRPSLPPLWSLGYIQSRCVFWNWQDIDSAYAGLTSKGYPVDCMVIDYNWPEYMNDFVWDKRWTVDGVSPGQRVKEYGKKGVKIVMSISGPMLKSDSPTFPSGVAAGVFATDGQGRHVKAGYYGGDLLDFTSPHMDSWLYPQLRPRNLEGVAGWWLDLTEPEGEPPQTIYDGGTAPEIHNEYSNLVTRAYEGSELQDHPNRRPFILTRAGSAGIQAHHATLWTGDINSDYVTLAAHPGEMLNSGISGLNSWTCDTGGFLTGYYKNDRFGAHARLYERWMQFSVFSPITRAHKAGLCMPYEFGPATEQGTKKYLNLRYRLLPYIYSHFYEASETGIPIVRAMAIEFPNDPNCLKVAGDQYMFGKNLLVAPVLTEGLTNRAVYFPPGKWIDWDYGYEYDGGRTWIVRAPQNRIPVAVRPGAIIPMAPNMANTETGKWDPLSVEIFPSNSSEFTMTQDDGKTFDYRQGKLTKTSFVSDERGSRLTFSIAASNGQFLPKVYLLRFHLDRKPLAALVDGTPLKARWDGSTRTLEIPVGSNRKLKHEVIVRLSPERLAGRPAPMLVADKVGPIGAATSGGPTPHFFPGPALPARLGAVDYDNGGEGVAYHVGRLNLSAVPYRPDNAGILRAPNSGGYVLGDLQKDDWVRYTVDAGNGGYFDLVAHVRGEISPYVGGSLSRGPDYGFHGRRAPRHHHPQRLSEPG
jgi:alpha-glucosidase